MNSLTQPRTIDEARRQIAIAERAKQVLAEGYTFWQDKEEEPVFVCKPGTLAFSYMIIEGECDCLDFQRRKTYCKHTVAWSIWQETVAACKLSIHGDGSYTLEITTKEDEAQIEAYEKMMGDAEDLRYGCDPHAEF